MTEPFVDPTDPAVRRFERALWELSEALRDLGVDTVHGPKDMYIVFGSETFQKLREQLIERPTLINYFRRRGRKKVDPYIRRWMCAGIQFGDIYALADAVNGMPFWPAIDRTDLPMVRFAAGCPSRREG